MSDKSETEVSLTGTRGLASVVVRARNEARFIERLLNDVRAQTYPQLEIVVVDSGSGDGTREIADRLADRVIDIPPDSFTFGRALNVGCAAASGEFLVFASAHTYPISNNWLRNLLAPFMDAKIGMVYGRQLPHESTRLDEERDLLANFGPHASVSFDDPVGPNNANAAVRRALWTKIPFDETLSGFEDLDWAKRIQARGYGVYYAENAGIVHIHNESLTEIHRRFRREGKALRAILPSYSLTFLGALRRWATSCLRDLEYGRANGAGRRIFAVPGARAAEFSGLYRGYRDQGRMRRASTRASLTRANGHRAVVITAPGVHRLVERDPPDVENGDVAIRVAYVGVCRTDIEVADGALAYYRDGRGRFPIVPGHEYAGVVEAVGAGVRQISPGERVVGECILGCRRCPACLAGRPTECERRRETGVLNKDGAYATRVVLPAASVHRIPDGVPLRHAALAEPIAVVSKAARLLEVAPGSRVCVVGAGPIGQLAAQVFRSFGAEVTIIDRDEQRLNHAAKLDFSTATSLEGPGLARATHVLEAVGSPSILGPLIEATSAGVRVCLLGVHLEDPHDHIDPVMLAERAVFPSLGSDPRDWPRALQTIDSGGLELEAMTASVLALHDYEEAWARCRAGQGLKHMLVVEGSLEGL